MRIAPRLTLYTLFASILFVGPSISWLGSSGVVYAFHFPWDQGHDVFQPEDGDDDTDPGQDSCNNSGSPFEVASGNYFSVTTDVVLPNVGFNIELSRAYNSRDMRSGVFGNGWSHKYDVKLIPTTNGIDYFAICRKGNGKRVRFSQISEGEYSLPPGDALLLRKESSGLFVITDTNGIRQTFDESLLLQMIEDRNGNLVKLLYDEFGFLTELTDSNGVVRLRFTKGANGKIANIADNAGRTYNYDYDERGNLIRYIDPLGRATQYIYDAKNNLMAVINPNGDHKLDVSYDSMQRVSSYTEDGNTRSILYFPGENKTTKTDAKGNRWTFFYNANGNITKEIDPAGNESLYGYNDNYYLNSLTDNRGNLETLNYSADGNVLVKTDALGNKIVFTYDSVFGNVASIKEPLGGVATFEYDARGNLTRRTDALGNSTFMTYIESGLVETVTDPLGNTRSFTYDAMGNTISETNPDGAQYLRGYDAVGNLISATDGMGNVYRFEYDLGDQIVSVTNAMGGVTHVDYDLNGNITKMTDPLGNETTFQYDDQNRLSAIQNPLGQMRRYEYDNVGQLVSMITPKGEQIRFVYDALGRVVEKRLPNDIAAFQYDQEGNLSLATDNDSRVSFAYNALNQLTNVSTDNGDLLYSYDANGNITKLVSPAGQVSYAYDASNRLTTIANESGELISVQYDSASRVTKMSRFNGHDTEMTYDSIGELTSLVHQSNTEEILRLVMSTNDNGERVSIDEGTGITAFSYDPLNQLVSVARPSGVGINESYQYDALGNRTSSHLMDLYEYNSASQLISDSSYDYIYDASGNLTEKRSRDTGEVINYFYDAENRRTRIEKNDGTVGSYKYDALGRRISKTVSGVVSQYLYDGYNLIQETGNGGSIVSRYIHGPDIDDPWVLEREGSSYTYALDPNQSVRAIIGDNGSLINEYSYDAFGNVMNSPGLFQQSFLFSSRERDIESGDYYFRARYYDPESGRFVSEDPVYHSPMLPFSIQRRGVADHLYLYTDNNPINYRDPLGLFSVDSSCNKAPFNKSKIKSAANSALNKITSGGCVGSKSLQEKLKKVFKTLTIKCDPKSKVCGYARIKLGSIFGNSIWIGPKGMNTATCGALGATILHEAVHRTQWWPSEDKPRACEKSCYGLYKSDPKCKASECK